MSVPIIFWLLLTGRTQVAFLIFVCAGISDAIDGYLAKRFDWRTELGAYLDPLADKLLIVSIYIALGVRGELPLWLIIMVVSRDILIVVAVLLSWLMDQPVVIKPLAVSKANTVAQIVLTATAGRRWLHSGVAGGPSATGWDTGLTLLSLAAISRLSSAHDWIRVRQGRVELTARLGGGARVCPAGGRRADMKIEKQLWFWLAAFALVVLTIALLKDILLPFVAAIVIAYFLNPLADRLEARGVGRVSAVTIIVGLAAVLIGLALVILVPLLAEQVRQLIARAPTEAERMKVGVEGFAHYWLGPNFPAFKVALDRALTEASGNWAAMVGHIVASMWSQGLALVNFLALVLITPVVVFYLLVDWHPMLERVDRTLPREHAATIRRLGGEINDAVSAFIRGQGAIGIMLGIYYAVGLSWAGIEYGLLVGPSTGLLAFIPVVGWLLGLIFASGLAIVQFWPSLAPLAKVVGVLVAGMAFDGQRSVTTLCRA